MNLPDRIDRRCHEARPARTGGFAKSDRVVGLGEFRRVYNRGFHASSHAFGCYVLPRRDGRKRLGLSVSRKYGDSPTRNRVKRLVREAFRRLRADLPGGMDIVVVARRGARGLPLGAVAVELEKLVGRALSDRQRRRKPS